MPAYGGLRGAVEYGAWSGYEVGFANIAEAVHCILGAITRGWPRAPEKNHVREEMGVIRKYLDYGRGKGFYKHANSPRRLVGERVGPEEPYPPEDAEASIHSIRKGSANIKAKVQRYLRELPEWNLSASSEALSEAAYRTALALAVTAEDSVKDWPRFIGNAYEDRRLVNAVRDLERVIGDMF